ncbi:MAG: peptidase, partial [Gammaproteobacteria bacterium]
MTYCIAVTLNEGLVLTSDSRTNAGIDNVSTHSKMHQFSVGADRKIVLLSAGNLATTQSVVEQLRRDIKENSKTNLKRLKYLSDAADYLGNISLEKQKKHTAGESQSSFSAAATFILAGQIGCEPPAAYLIYPEGNSITPSPHAPFLQIGESKYGKPVLDRFLTPETSLEVAAKCCLVSMDSTMRSNASVGPPIEVLLYRRDSFSFDEYYRFDTDNEYMQTLRRAWDNKLKQAFLELPELQKTPV